MKLAFAVLLLSLTLAAQKPAPKYPHPFVQTSVSLNGTSESTLSLEGKAGVTIEEKHVLADTFAFYNTLKKNAPGIAQTSHGRKRAVGGDLFYHRKTWHYGVGAEFAEFAQTEYTKRSTFLFAGLGKDINDTARLRAMYLHAFNEQTRYPEGRGCQCTNGVQGIRFEAWLPNPARRHHWPSIPSLCFRKV